MASELKKDLNRWNIFLEKILNQNLFLTSSGESILILKENELLLEALRNKDVDSYKSAFKKGIKCINSLEEVFEIKSPSILCKTQEFGGKSSNHGTKAQDIQILNLKESIKNAKRDSSSIVLKLNSGKSVQVSDIVENKIPHEKADAFFVNENSHIVLRISLKYADSPNQMQQWGGVNKALNHDEVKRFIELSKSIQSKGDFLKSRIKCHSLKEYAVFGDDKDGVDIVIASKDNGLNLLEDGSWAIKGSVFEKETPPNDGWEPALVARYGRGRGGRIGLSNARVGIFPIDYRHPI